MQKAFVIYSFFIMVIFILSLLITFLFFLYGFNLYYLLFSAKNYQTPALEITQGPRPTVCIHIPIYNEKAILNRVAAACAAMADSFGRQNVRILILDDSDDDTPLEVDRIVHEYQQRQIQMEVLRRQNREGYKAGALQAALEKTPEEFIAVFDADFVPPVNFLDQTIPYIVSDPHLGIVQSRWTFTNQDFNLVTRAISHIIDLHFLIEQPGRYTAGCFQNFNGSGGVLRKKAILEAGGWQSDTLAEDLDLSYRMQLHGYRVLYLKNVLCPGQIPPTIASFKLQQSRWANGSMKVALKILPDLMKSHLFSWQKKFLAFLHLTGYLIQPLMVASFILAVLASIINYRYLHLHTPGSAPALPIGWMLYLPAGFTRLQDTIWACLTPLIAACTLAPWVGLIYTLQKQKLSVLRNVLNLLVLLLISFGISLSVVKGTFRALFTRRKWNWTRTPKLADLPGNQKVRRESYFLPLDPIWIAEILFAAAGVLASWFSWLNGNISGMLILVPFTISYLFVLLSSVMQSRRIKA